MTDGLIEQVATSLCQSALRSKKCPCLESGVFRCADEYPGTQARAILPIIKAERIRGGEMVREAAARENLMICLTNCEEWTDEAMEALNFATDRIRALSVPAIVEAGEHQPKENTDASSD